MHGRLKVKTSEEQAEAKKREQQEKLKLYCGITSKIFSKRSVEEYDDEGLELTARILEKNPDFYTLWNFRREILLCFKKKKSEDELKKIFLVELDLTQNSLRVNPKSYSVWNHRLWVNEFNFDADWKRELKLCSDFLSKDERNFHCWDYRRVVCKKCNISPEEELLFSTKMIESNFSNYSAWHYRSTLLPIVHPGSAVNSVKEEVLHKEFDLIQNAAFTDPEDQSVWFYHRWLLGRNKKPLEVLNISIVPDLHRIMVLLSEPIKVNSKNLSLEINCVSVPVIWNSVEPSSLASSLWVCKYPSILEECCASNKSCTVSVHLVKENHNSTLACDVASGSVWKSLSRTDSYRSELSAATKDVLERELESCQQLNELEPNCKWTLFSSVLLMRALDGFKYQSAIQKCMKQLVVVDALRKNYYQDLESKFAIEDYLGRLPLNATQVDLSKKHLTRLEHFDQLFLVQSLNLSSNHLTSIRSIRYLLCLKHLILDDNQLEDFKGMENLQNMTSLSAKRNQIRESESLQSLKCLKSLRELCLDENPLSHLPTWVLDLKMKTMENK